LPTRSTARAASGTGGPPQPPEEARAAPAATDDALRPDDHEHDEQRAVDDLVPALEEVEVDRQRGEHDRSGRRAPEVLQAAEHDVQDDYHRLAGVEVARPHEHQEV